MKGSKTIQSRQLGRQLRELRKEANVSAGTAAAELGISEPTLYRWEAGANIPRPPDVRELCNYYNSDDSTTNALKALAREADHPGWWRSYNGAIPRSFEPFVILESAATRIRAYDAEVIPGWFQTRPYAEATARMVRPVLNDEDHRQVVSVRIERQKLLIRRHPPMFEVVIGEAAVAKSLVDADQLARLDELSRLPNVSLRALPLEVSHCALPHGSRFYILDYPPSRNAEPTTVYSEHLTGGIYLDKPPDVAAYDAVWREVWTVALSPAETRKLIDKYRRKQ